MIIEKMTIEHLEKIKDILQEEYDDFWNYNILKKELDNENSQYLVVIENEDILGFAGIQFILDEADITNIVIKKSERNKGIGTELLNKIVEIAKKNGAKSLTLEVNENNKYAIKLYEKFDFEEIGRRKKYYNGIDTAIIMKKEIWYNSINR